MILMTPDGRRIDISVELYEILAIGQWYGPGSTIHPGDAKMLHRLGWGLISIGGPDMALGLLANLQNDRLINPHFAGYLRSKWGAIAADFEDI
jgi:hypothetical protein